MLLKCIIVFLVLLAVLVLVIATRPNHFEVQRSIRMYGPPNLPYELVNDPRKISQWNYFVRLDPDARHTLSGNEVGEGSIFEWDGNKNVGAGRQTIVECRPDELIRMKLEFFRPFPGENEVTFTFVPEGRETVVTWSMKGPCNFMMKAISMVINMDKMCGDGFEQGLKDMKAIVET